MLAGSGCVLSQRALFVPRTEGNWEKRSGQFLINSGFSALSLCRDVVSWSAWLPGPSTARWPRRRLEKQLEAGRVRRVYQTVTLRCGNFCRGRRTDSVVA